MSQSLHASIADCERHIAIMREDLIANEKHLYNLYVQLQAAAAAAAAEGEAYLDSEEEEGWGVPPRAPAPVSPTQEEISQFINEALQEEEDYQKKVDEAYQNELAEAAEEARQAELAEEAYQAQLAAAEEARQAELAELSLKEELVLKHPVGTKLKWVLDEETYRVAIVTKKGILQVKSVTDGAGDCHEAGCKCEPCIEIALSGGAIPPWRRGRPLKKTSFPSESEWYKSLPSNGKVIIIQPEVSDSGLKKLSGDPLLAKTDPLKLKELEGRFPGATMVLSTTKKQGVVKYVYEDMYVDTSINHKISCEFAGPFPWFDFASIGASPRKNGKPQLMAEWRDIYIDLSHLF
jgi:hypothetical protein